MPTYFAVSLLTIVVVAGIAAAGWVRGRSSKSEDASNKKTDKEVMTDNNIEIIVATEKQSLIMANPPNDDSNNQTTHSIASLGNTLSNKLSLELATLDEEVADTAVKSVSTSKASTSENTACRTKPKANNISSFVRQCVSNIERSTFAANALPSRTISPRHSTSSNQCESPPKSRPTDELRLPSLVTATDCDSNESRMCEDVDEEGLGQIETVMKRVLRRVPSDHATPIAFARPHALTKAPTLEPFAAIALKTMSPNSLPPMWTRVDKPEASVHMSEGNESAPDEAEVPEKEALKDSVPALDDEEEGTFLSMPPLPPSRKISNASSRLLQFQKLVPSNQARSSLGQ